MLWPVFKVMSMSSEIREGGSTYGLLRGAFHGASSYAIIWYIQERNSNIKHYEGGQK